MRTHLTEKHQRPGNAWLCLRANDSEHSIVAKLSTQLLLKLFVAQRKKLGLHWISLDYQQTFPLHWSNGRAEQDIVMGGWRLEFSTGASKGALVSCCLRCLISELSNKLGSASVSMKVGSCIWLHTRRQALNILGNPRALDKWRLYKIVIHVGVNDTSSSVRGNQA